MPPDHCMSIRAPPHFVTLSGHSSASTPSHKSVESLSTMTFQNHSLPVFSNSRETRQPFEFDSLYNILHLILFGVAMRMAYEFWLRKLDATSTTTTSRANKPSRVARKQEISPDTSVEVNPVPPSGWRRSADPPGNKGRAPLEPFYTTASEPSLCTHRSYPVYAIQAGADVEDSADASLLHCIFNHAPVDRITRTIQATKGLLRHYLQQAACDSCTVTRATRHTARRQVHLARQQTQLHDGRPASMAAHLYSLDPDDPILGEHQEDIMSEGDSDEEECLWEPEPPHPIQSAVEDYANLSSQELAWEEEDPDEDEDSLATQYVMNVMADTPIYDPEEDPLLSTSYSDAPALDTDSDTSNSEEDGWTEGEYDSDESEAPIYTAAGEPLAEGGDDLNAVGETWCEIEYQAEEFGRVYSKGIPRHDIDKLRPFEIVFCDNKDYDCPQRGGHTTDR